MVISTEQTDGVLFELSPNRSASWQQIKWIILVMLIVVMIIALAWTFVGAWIVLPFAGFEVGLFAFLMYRVSRFTYSKQILFINKKQVVVEQGHAKRRIKHVLDRENLHVAYWESKLDWELPRIALKNDHDELEIGDFLNLDDRKKLKNLLEDSGFMILRKQWWRS